MPDSLSLTLFKSLQVKKTAGVRNQLQSYLIQVIRKQCSDCYDLTPSFLRPGMFLCHGNPTKTTYRSTLVNPFPTTTTTTTAARLVGIIQSWVSTNASFILDDLLVRVPTHISLQFPHTSHYSPPTHLTTVPPHISLQFSHTSYYSSHTLLVLQCLQVRVSGDCPTSVSSLDEGECESGTRTDTELGERITQTLNLCANRDLGREVCRLRGC